MHHSTVSREISRNSITTRESNYDRYATSYSDQTAQKKYIDCRAVNNKRQHQQ